MLSGYHFDLILTLKSYIGGKRTGSEKKCKYFMNWENIHLNLFRREWIYISYRIGANTERKFKLVTLNWFHRNMSSKVWLELSHWKLESSNLNVEQSFGFSQLFICCKKFCVSDKKHSLQIIGSRNSHIQTFTDIVQIPVTGISRSVWLCHSSFVIRHVDINNHIQS